MNAVEPMACPKQSGFTLLELIGSMAILAMLTWLAADGVFRRAKESQRRYEASRLAEIGSAFTRGVLRHRVIPAETNWVSMTATELAEPERRVLRNESGWNRRLIYDPTFRAGATWARPPYAQTSAGSLAPTNVRAVLLSTVAADFPSLASVRFEDLWERAPHRLPENWSTRWAGKPDDLFIERVNFAGQFHRVCLNNLNLDSPATYGVDATNPIASIAARGRWDAYLLTGSRLCLLASDGSVQLEEFVRRSVSYTFEGDRWHSGLSSGLGTSSGLIAAQFDQFGVMPVGPSGLAPGEVAAAMHELLREYVGWADSGFVRATGAGTTAPPFRRCTEARARLLDFAGWMVGQAP